MTKDSTIMDLNVSVAVASSCISLVESHILSRSVMQLSYCLSLSNNFLVFQLLFFQDLNFKPIFNRKVVCRRLIVFVFFRNVFLFEVLMFPYNLDNFCSVALARFGHMARHSNVFSTYFTKIEYDKSKVIGRT